MKQRGFTLIELLIVVALIGILAVALLSAINPIEQGRKARDSGRKSDSAELLNAVERYNATFGCYPWNRTGGTCGTTSLTAQTVDTNDFSGAGILADLITVQELKSQYANRDAITKQNMYISEASGPNGIVSVCAEPESTSWRAGGGGSIRNATNAAAGSCTGTYNGTGGATTCNVCVPQ